MWSDRLEREHRHVELHHHRKASSIAARPTGEPQRADVTRAGRLERGSTAAQPPTPIVSACKRGLPSGFPTPSSRLHDGQAAEGRNDRGTSSYARRAARPAGRGRGSPSPARAPARTGEIFRSGLLPCRRASTSWIPRSRPRRLPGHSSTRRARGCCPFRTRPPPAGFRLQPEVAAAFPTVSRDGRTYTFKLRNGFRFSDGARYARPRTRGRSTACSRPRLAGDWIYVRDIVGAGRVVAGQAALHAEWSPTGTRSSSGSTVRSPDFVTARHRPSSARSLPALPDRRRREPGDPRRGPVPRHRVPARRARRDPAEPLLRRPREGTTRRLRRQPAGGLAARDAERVDQGDADWGHTLAGIYLDPSLELVRRSGINRSRLLPEAGADAPHARVEPRLGPCSGTTRGSGRPSTSRSTGARSCRRRPDVSRPSDQHLPSHPAGFRDADVYPLERADLPTARALAGGTGAEGRPFFTSTVPRSRWRSASSSRQQLAMLGLDVEVRGIPIYIAWAEYLKKLAAPGEEWDIALGLWTPNVPDPHAYLCMLLVESQQLGGEDASRGYESRLVRTAMQRRSPACHQEARTQPERCGQIDAMLARDVAPVGSTERSSTRRRSYRTALPRGASSCGP